jgi:hypothetical protein
VARKRPFKMAVFSPAFRNSKLSELLEQCVRIPNSSASIRFLAVLIEGCGRSTDTRGSALEGTARGTQNCPRRLCWGCRLCRPSAWYFYSDGSDGDVFVFPNNNRETRVASGTGCSVRRPALDPILSLKRPGNLLFEFCVSRKRKGRPISRGGLRTA